MRELSIYRRPSPVSHTEHPPLFTTQWAGSSTSCGSVCNCWNLLFMVSIAACLQQSIAAHANRKPHNTELPPAGSCVLARKTWREIPIDTADRPSPPGTLGSAGSAITRHLFGRCDTTDQSNQSPLFQACCTPATEQNKLINLTTTQLHLGGPVTAQFLPPIVIWLWEGCSISQGQSTVILVYCVHSYISKICQNFIKLSVHITRSHRSVLFWWRWNVMYLRFRGWRHVFTRWHKYWTLAHYSSWLVSGTGVHWTESGPYRNYEITQSPINNWLIKVK